MSSNSGDPAVAEPTIEKKHSISASSKGSSAASILSVNSSNIPMLEVSGATTASSSSSSSASFGSSSNSILVDNTSPGNSANELKSQQQDVASSSPSTSSSSKSSSNINHQSKSSKLKHPTAPSASNLNLLRVDYHPSSSSSSSPSSAAAAAAAGGDLSDETALGSMTSFSKRRVSFDRHVDMRRPITPSTNRSSRSSKVIGVARKRQVIRAMDEEGKVNEDNMEQLEELPNSLYIFEGSNCFRLTLIQLMQNWWFQQFILFCILFNAILLGIDQPGVTWEDDVNMFLYVADIIFTVVFTAEMFIKIVALGLAMHEGAYLRNGWNILDFLIVIAAIINLSPQESSNLSALRVVRVLRPLRSVSRIPELRILIQSLLKAVPQVFDNILLFLFFLAIFAITGLQLWRGKLSQVCFAKFENTSEWWPQVYGNITHVIPVRRCGGTFDCSSRHIQNATVTCDVREELFFPSFRNFDHFGVAAIYMFKLMVLDNWTDDIMIMMDAVGADVVIFMLFVVVLGFYCACNLFFAVLSNAYSDVAESGGVDNSDNVQDSQFRDATTWIDVDKIDPMTLKEIAASALMEGTRDCLFCCSDDSQQEELDAKIAEIFADTPAGDKMGCKRSGTCSAKKEEGEREKKQQEEGEEEMNEKNNNSNNSNSNNNNLENKEGDENNTEETTTGMPELEKPLEDILGKFFNEHIPSEALEVSDEAFGAVDNVPLEYTVEEIQNFCTNVVATQREEIDRTRVETAEENRADATLWGLPKTFRKNCKDDRHIVRCFLGWLVSHRITELIMLIVTIINTVVLALDHYDIDANTSHQLDIISVVCTAFFTLEIIIKLFAFGFWDTLTESFNALDFIIVLESLIQYAVSGSIASSGLAALRVLRTLRVLKLLTMFPSLQLIVRGVLHSMGSIGYLSLLILLHLYVFAILGMQIFGTSFKLTNPDEVLGFDTTYESLLIAFIVLTGDSWTDRLRAGMFSMSEDLQWIAVVYFVLLFFIGNFVLVNLMVAIILDHMQELMDVMEQSRNVDTHPPTLILPPGFVIPNRGLLAGGAAAEDFQDMISQASSSPGFSSAGSKRSLWNAITVDASGSVGIKSGEFFDNPLGFDDSMNADHSDVFKSRGGSAASGSHAGSGSGSGSGSDDFSSKHKVLQGENSIPIQHSEADLQLASGTSSAAASASHSVSPSLAAAAAAGGSGGNSNNNNNSGGNHIPLSAAGEEGDELLQQEEGDADGTNSQQQHLHATSSMRLQARSRGGGASRAGGRPKSEMKMHIIQESKSTVFDPETGHMREPSKEERELAKEKALAANSRNIAIDAVELEDIDFYDKLEVDYFTRFYSAVKTLFEPDAIRPSSEPSLYIFDVDGRIRVFCTYLHSLPIYNLLVFIAVVINVIFLFLENPANGEPLAYAIRVADIVVASIFGVDMLTKIIAFGLFTPDSIDVATEKMKDEHDTFQQENALRRQRTMAIMKKQQQEKDEQEEEEEERKRKLKQELHRDGSFENNTSSNEDTSNSNSHENMFGGFGDFAKSMNVATSGNSRNNSVAKTNNNNNNNNDHDRDDEDEDHHSNNNNREGGDVVESFDLVASSSKRKERRATLKKQQQQQGGGGGEAALATSSNNIPKSPVEALHTPNSPKSPNDSRTVSRSGTRGKSFIQPAGIAHVHIGASSGSVAAAATAASAASLRGGEGDTSAVCDQAIGAYCRDAWNLVDGVVTIVSIVGFFVPSLKFLRSLRTFRLLSRIEGARIILEAVVASLPMVMNGLLLSLLAFMMFGVLGVQLFKGSMYICNDRNISYRYDCVGYFNGTEADPITGLSKTLNMTREWTNARFHFDDFPNAILSLFVIVAGDSWALLMYQGMDVVGENYAMQSKSSPGNAMFFVAAYVVGNIFCLNMIIGILLNFFQRQKDIQDGSAFLTEKQRKFLRARQTIEMTWLPVDEDVLVPLENCFSQGVHRVLTFMFWELRVCCCGVPISEEAMASPDLVIQPASPRNGGGGGDNDSSPSLKESDSSGGGNTGSKNPLVGSNASSSSSSSSSSSTATTTTTTASSAATSAHQEMPTLLAPPQQKKHARSSLHSHEDFPEVSLVDELEELEASADLDNNKLDASGGGGGRTPSRLSHKDVDAADDEESEKDKHIQTTIAQAFFYLVITLNLIINAIEYKNMPGELKQTLFEIELACLIIFTIELGLKAIAYGPQLVTASATVVGWTVFDTIIVVFGFVGLAHPELSFLSFLRALRLLKLLRGTGVEKMLLMLVRSFRQIFNVFIVLVLTYFIFAVAGVALFGDADYDPNSFMVNENRNFKNVHLAMLLLFQASTTDGWGDFAADISHPPPEFCDPNKSGSCISRPLANGFFIVFMCMVTWIGLQMFVAILIEVFDQFRTVQTDDDPLHDAFGELRTKYDAVFGEGAPDVNVHEFVDRFHELPTQLTQFTSMDPTPLERLKLLGTLPIPVRSDMTVAFRDVVLAFAFKHFQIDARSSSDFLTDVFRGTVFGIAFSAFQCHAVRIIQSSYDIKKERKQQMLSMSLERERGEDIIILNSDGDDDDDDHHQELKEERKGEQEQEEKLEKGKEEDIHIAASLVASAMQNADVQKQEEEQQKEQHGQVEEIKE